MTLAFGSPRRPLRDRYLRQEPPVPVRQLVCAPSFATSAFRSLPSTTLKVHVQAAQTQRLFAPPLMSPVTWGTNSSMPAGDPLPAMRHRARPSRLLSGGSQRYWRSVVSCVTVAAPCRIDAGGREGQALTEHGPGSTSWRENPELLITSTICILHFNILISRQTSCKRVRKCQIGVIHRCFGVVHRCCRNSQRSW